MGDDRKTIHYESPVKTSRACECLEGVLSGLKAGAIYIKNNDGCAVLKPGGKIRLFIGASAGQEKSKLKISLKWHRPENDMRQGDLFITPTEIVEALGLFVKKKEAAKAIKKKTKK